MQWAMAAYEISNRALSEDDPELQAALRAAHASGVRPLCLCRPLSAKPPMVIERRTAGGPAANGCDAQAHDLYILRRMPERGHEQRTTCKHYEAPEGLSGRTGHLDGAIRSDDDGVHHRLRLAFPLSHKKKGTSTNEDTPPGDPARAAGQRYARLSLTGFLHHVLEDGRSQQDARGLHGKRSWNVMRGRILETMRAQATSRHRDLAAFAFAPRIFSVEHRQELFATGGRSSARAGAEKRSILLFAELKDVDAGFSPSSTCPSAASRWRRRSATPFLEALERSPG